MGTTRDLRYDIDALFEHMKTNLEHSPDDVLDWSFRLEDEDTDKLGSIAGSLESEFEVWPVESIRVDEQDQVTSTPMIAIGVTGALSPDEVKALAKRFEALAHAEGVSYEGVTCAEAMTEEMMEAMFGWLSLEDADWRLRHLTDIGLEPDEPMLYEFGIVAEAKATLDAIVEALGPAGFIVDEMGEDEDGPYLAIRVRGSNNSAPLAQRYREVEQAVAQGNAELLGVQFPEDEDDSEEE